MFALIQTRVRWRSRGEGSLIGHTFGIKKANTEILKLTLQNDNAMREKTTAAIAGGL
jgi:hypothetical protein